MLSLTDYPSKFSKTTRQRPERVVARPLPAEKGHQSTFSRRGADGDRTHGLRLAKPALSQLSYSPQGKPQLIHAFLGLLYEGRPEASTNDPSGLPSSRRVRRSRSSDRTNATSSCLPSPPRLTWRADCTYVARLRESSASKVGPGRVELPTSPLSGARSSQLSYGPCSDGGPRPSTP